MATEPKRERKTNKQNNGRKLCRPFNKVKEMATQTSRERNVRDALEREREKANKESYGSWLIIQHIEGDGDTKRERERERERSKECNGGLMILSTTTHWRDWSTSASTPFADAVLFWSLWYCATAANRPKRQGSYWTHRAPPLLCLCVCGIPLFFSCLPFFFFIVFFLFFFFFFLLLLLPHQKRTNQRLYRSCAASFFFVLTKLRQQR